MQYKITTDSMCFGCHGVSEGEGRCYPRIISEIDIYQNMGTKRLFIFAHDIAECGGLCEVEVVE